jgi:hypothetical protein
VGCLTWEPCKLTGFGPCAQWEPVKQPVSLARHALAVVECRELIYAIGGWVDGTYGTGLTECFDPRTEVWQTCAPMAIPRRLHAAAATQWDNKVYVFGGAVEGEKCCKVRTIRRALRGPSATQFGPGERTQHVRGSLLLLNAVDTC